MYVRMLGYASLFWRSEKRVKTSRNLLHIDGERLRGYALSCHIYISILSYSLNCLNVCFLTRDPVLATSVCSSKKTREEALAKCLNVFLPLYCRLGSAGCTVAVPL